MKKKITVSIILLLISCGVKQKGDDVLPISTFFNNRMTLLLKGTYATDNPLLFSEYSNGAGNLYVDGDADADLAELPLAKDLGYFLDIGEIRISSKLLKGYGDLAGIQTAQDSKDFWDHIANVRQVYCTKPYSLDDNQCKANAGYLTVLDLFNGNGVVYPSNDPTAETKSSDGIVFVPTLYYYTGIYFRSIVTTWARGKSAMLTTRFDNADTTGENIVPRNNYRPGLSTADKGTFHPGLFPLLYSVKAGQADMGIRGGQEPYILEVRANLKENLMVHTYTDNASPPVTRTIIGYSDWKFDHNGESDMGGNLLSRSRVIYPETASSVSITGGTKSLIHYYAIYRAEETEILGELPLVATPVQQGTSTIKYIQEGTYRLFCLGDLTRQDGIPDTIVRETTFAVSSFPFKQKITVDLACP